MVLAASMSEPPAKKVSAGVRLGLCLLILVPCLPGFTFLLAGFLTDPHRQAAPSAVVAADDARRWARTRGLYLAGAVVLMVGTLGGAAVVWKIARPGPSYEGEARLEKEREQTQG